MMASYLSTGKSSIGETNWMPALLTSTSSLPNAPMAPSIIPTHASAFIRLAPSKRTLTPASRSRLDRMRSISAGSPSPFSVTSMPALAKAVATAKPMPLVEPVTRAALRSLMCLPLRYLACAAAWEPLAQISYRPSAASEGPDNGLYRAHKRFCRGLSRFPHPVRRSPGSLHRFARHLCAHDPAQGAGAHPRRQPVSGAGVRWGRGGPCHSARQLPGPCVRRHGPYHLGRCHIAASARGLPLRRHLPARPAAAHC